MGADQFELIVNIALSEKSLFCRLRKPFKSNVIKEFGYGTTNN